LLPFTLGAAEPQHLGVQVTPGGYVPTTEYHAAHALFDRVTIRRKEGVDFARHFEDYTVSVNVEDLPPGVSLIQRI